MIDLYERLRISRPPMRTSRLLAGLTVALPVAGIGVGLLSFTARPDGSVMRQSASVDSEAAENVDALADFFENAARSHVVSLKMNSVASESTENHSLTQPRKSASSTVASAQASMASFGTPVMPPRRPFELRSAQGEQAAPADAVAPPANGFWPPRPPLPIRDVMASFPPSEPLHPLRYGMQLVANAGRFVSDSTVVQGAISAAGALGSFAKQFH